MYVKEDIILPHTISFYDLIVNKAMGKSGPLFQFDLHEHAAASFDPRVKSQDSHAGGAAGQGLVTAALGGQLLG
jgi:protein FAM50